MSSRLAGTRQVRNSIRHIIFSSRVFYGIPVFMTFTPSERHNGLMIRLYRGRVKDPAFAGAAHDLSSWISQDAPSLMPSGTENANKDSTVIDLPDYDTRRRFGSRDPLCCVYAFDVMTKMVLPSLHGFRMCPECPACALSKDACMDSFGSNATLKEE